MKIEFRPNATHDANRLGVAFTAYVDDHPRRCLVSDEALDDHFQGDHARTSQARVELFEKNRARFESVVREFITEGYQGDIILTTDDFA